MIRTINPDRYHLTATNKKHIEAILAAGLMAARVNRTEYRLETDGRFYTVRIIARVDGQYQSYKCQFTHNPSPASAG